MDAILRHPKPSHRPIVAFDFDGTLTSRDSFISFIQWRVGRAKFMAGLPSLAPKLFAYGADGDRGRLKAAVALRFLGRLHRATLAAEAERFRAACLDNLIRPDALECWRDWRARGVRLVIVTASPEILVTPFAHALGAEAVLGTRLAFDAEDRFTGALDGPNCRGREKVARLEAWLGETPRLAAAYGDTGGDREMLEIADEPYMKLFKDRS